MNKTTDIDKLKHSFMNSIAIINGMSKSASNFINKLPELINTDDFNQKQIEKFLYSMNAIRKQTKKIEDYFQQLLQE